MNLERVGVDCRGAADYGKELNFIINSIEGH